MENASHRRAALKALQERFPEHHRRTGRPFVTLSYAQSLDGSIAARPGQPLQLSSTAALRYTHELRAIHRSILVGIGTVLADDPRLTVRHVEGHHPRPVVVDTQLRFPKEAFLLTGSGPNPIIAAGEKVSRERAAHLESCGATVLYFPTNRDGSVNLDLLLQELGRREVASVMVEGGSEIITSFLSRRLVDHLIVTVVPVLIGGLQAVQELQLASGSDEAVECERFPRLRNLSCRRLEDDVILEGDPSWEERT